MSMHEFSPGVVSAKGVIVGQSQKMLKGVGLLLLVAVLGALSLLWTGTSTSHAHEVQPAVADLTFDGQGGFQVSIVLNLEAIIAQIEPDVQNTADSVNALKYDQLRALGSEELGAAFEEFSRQFLDGLHLQADGSRISATIESLRIPEAGDLDYSRESVINLKGELPENAQTFVWGWDRAFGSSVIRVNVETDEEPYTAYLIEGQDSDPLAIQGVEKRGTLATITSYLVIGYTHILPKGIDHILFVVGLFLLSTRLHPLLWQITAFTVAHTITLALGITGTVTISPAIVEPLIALSITYVCVENILTQELTRWRPIVVFGFGLLHGLGFAGVLKEIGLAPDQFVTGLISFNVGVELGQLSIIAICFLAVGLWFRNKSWYRKVVVIPSSLVIGLIGGWWFIERTLLSW